MGLRLKILSIAILLGFYSLHVDTILKIFKIFGISIFLFLFIIHPIIFKLFYPIQRSLFFLSYINRPTKQQLNDVNKIGIPFVRNFYLTTDENIRLGIWQILPNVPEIKIPESEENQEKYYEQMLSSGRPIIIYMHGNSGSRLSDHRVQLYKVILNLNYHLITFDYRNYGDSTRCTITEDGLVSDGLYVYKWVYSKAKGAPIFLWGHSLGTGVSSHLVEKLEMEGCDNIKGLILEAPFNNMRAEICEHPFSLIYRYLPFFEFFFLEPVRSNGICFESDRHLANSSCPILILHSEDDFIVPFVLAERLYESVKKHRSESAGKIEFVRFDKRFGYGHISIYKAPELTNYISTFVNENIEMKPTNNGVLGINENKL